MARLRLAVSGLLVLAAVLLAAAPARFCCADRRFCVLKEELGTCLNMTAILQSLDAEDEHTWSCVQGDDDDDCIEKVGKGEAEYVLLDAGAIFDAYEDYGLYPLLKEKLPGNGVLNYAVAVVHASDCKTGMTLADLKGYHSCHTYYHDDEGWYLPISYMTSGSPPIMPIVNNNGSEEVDIQTVEAFFSTTCAPSEDSDDADGDGQICSGCAVKSGCDNTDTYYNYEGSFRCMVEGGSQYVTFNKHTTAIDYSLGGPLVDVSWKNLETADSYKLVCPAGGCAAVTDYATCNFGTTVAHALMVSPTAAEDEINEFLATMDKFNTDSRAVSLFWSGKNTMGYVFDSEALGLERVPNGTSAITYIGPLYDAITNVKKLDSTPVTAAPPSSAVVTTASMAIAVVSCTLLLAAHLLI
eukprot:SM000288S10780  [mRNA]  locus=s288:118515:121301:- [translate_table: standard]